jgi:wyosine [tRNA(Phe)-imidazoG37] synthetase (radical SAM superfamily)
MKAFGPVPSRRLGVSLGINNIPFKHCSYSCLYCQVKKTAKREIIRQKFYDPEIIVQEVYQLLQNAEKHDRIPDYLTIVPDGEPTLDINLGKLIGMLKQFNIPIAIITNGTLIDNEKVREDLNMADYVSLKVDAYSVKTWRRINKPAPGLELNKIRKGMQSFAGFFKGKLTTETMLLKGINNEPGELLHIAEFISHLNPAMSYLAVPTRPTAYRNIESVDNPELVKTYEIFEKVIPDVQFLNDYEGVSFTSTGNLEQDLLSIASVHPLREEAVFALHKQTNRNINILNRLLETGQMEKINFNGHVYYLRKFGLLKTGVD